jgi:hypothetical protein
MSHGSMLLQDAVDTAVDDKGEVKGLLREAEVRTYEALVETIGMALSAITVQEALGYFEHCGYHASDRTLFDVRVVLT